jgi:phage-related minor tail protein
MSASSSATEKTLARIRAGISLGLMQYEKIEELMKSNSGNVDDLRREASALAQALDLIDEQSKKLDPNDPGLIVPREVVTSLASQASTGEAVISEWLDSRKAAAVDAIQIGVAQANSLDKMSSKLQELLEEESSISS